MIVQCEEGVQVAVEVDERGLLRLEATASSGHPVATVTKSHVRVYRCQCGADSSHADLPGHS